MARVVVLPVLVVCRPRWPPVPGVLAVALVVLVVRLARSAQVQVPDVAVDPVRRVRVVVYRVKHTRVQLLVLRVLLLVVRWVLALALPVPGLVLVWALVVVLQVLARVCQALRGRYRVQLQQGLVLVLRPVVVVV